MRLIIEESQEILTTHAGFLRKTQLRSRLNASRLAGRPEPELATNNLVLRFALLAFNILRLMGQAMLGDPMAPLRKARQRWRIRTVIQDLIYLAARLVVHARQVWLRYGRGNRWGQPLRRVYEAFA